ncbi:uncharacterized protein LOC105424607 isoform X1 [Pogonomyrmex barbatus]|uniref:Uncharacterized protein LOC105424607 isoform X1 n=1 Tax=Pogonomyrmex barbatus TaxID=144034 RepID=A0A6I9VVP2_9HYME|nr:uncharacterized protein LOC105424607 isoform X1 [Pogonomyrmex barbatus]
MGIGASRGFGSLRAASATFGGFWFLPRPPKRCQRVRRPAAQQACALSRFFVPFLAYQKHESDRPRIYPWCSTARRYNAVRISSAEIRAALALVRVPPRHTAQPSATCACGKTAVGWKRGGRGAQRRERDRERERKTDVQIGR